MRGNLISGVTGGLCVALLMCLFGAGRTDTVVARQLVLVDENGKKVGQIGSDDTGEPFLQFLDSNGNVRLLFGLLKETDGVTRTTALKLMNHDSSAVTVLDPTTQQSLLHYSRTRSRGQQGQIYLLGGAK